MCTNYGRLLRKEYDYVSAIDCYLMYIYALACDGRSRESIPSDAGV